MNKKIMALVAKAKDVYDANKVKLITGATTAAITFSNLAVSASAAEGDATANLSSDLVNAMSSVDYSVILTCVVALVPAVFPAVFGLIAVRKGIGFVLGMVRGA